MSTPLASARFTRFDLPLSGGPRQDGGSRLADAAERRPGRIAGLWRRLIRYRRTHGTAATLHRSGQIAAAHAMRPLALALSYYPQVARDVLRWNSRTEPTVLGLVEGERRFASGRFAVFVMWQPEHTPWYVLNALKALGEVGANVLLVVNHPLDAARLQELAPLCARIMIRDNTGLDMGAYKDAIAALAGERIGRLLLLNDSVYYFEAGLAGLFERLFASRADLCASHENVQFTPHLQSFCLSVSGRLARGARFRRFWERYVPVQSRRWAIHKGEIGLSAALMPAASDIEVIYRAEDVASSVLDAGIADPVSHLPLPQRLQLEIEPDTVMSGERLASLLKRGSQIHTGGFLFRQAQGAPILKRDLVFRLQFTAEECRARLEAVGHEGHLGAIMADLTRKGPPPAYGTWRHARWATGLI